MSKAPLQFQILGPLEVGWQSKRITLGGSRQQVVLAMLLLEADRLVSVDQLVDAVWDEHPPATARSQIQICISSLRRTFLATSDSGLILTRKPGYQLEVGDAVLDSRLFEARVAEGRRMRAAGEEGQAAAKFRAALDLWRGPALSSVSSRLVQYGATLLNDRHLNAAEEYFDVGLRTGSDHELVSEMVGFADQYPLRERFRALLMTALYRSGRQAEALAVYRAARKLLMDELGIEPGAELQRLHEAVLNGTPIPSAAESVELWPRTRSGASAPLRAADSAAHRAQRTVPRLLPPTIADFTGREAIVDHIAAELGTERNPVAAHALPITVIYGQGGAGKTTLAVHVAHLLTEQFPDGQLFARLRSGDQAADPADVLRRFLRALGMSDSALPARVDERAENFRNMLSDSKTLVVLDDAMSEQQLSYLLPGSARCAVLVTSRRRLAILPARHRYEVEPLQRQASLALLARIAGRARTQSEPEAVSALCELCGDLPLALRIVSARLAARPHWSTGALVERLTDESRRLDELDHGGAGMRASIAMSYDSLSADARRLFRRLALLDATNFAYWIGAPLLGVEVSYAEELFEELAEAYLLDIDQSPAAEMVRYRFHDMMRPFARERLLSEDTAQERRQALEQMIGALLGLASEAHRREYSGDYLLPVNWAACWSLPEPLVDRLLEVPLAWYEDERQSITAAVRQAAASGLVEHSWQLALSAVALFEAHLHFHDWRETHETALLAACRVGDKKGEAAMRYSLGSLHMFEQQNVQASRQFVQAYELYRQLGDHHGAALVQRNMAMLDRRQGNLELALRRWEEALDTLLLVGDRIAEAHVLYNMAQTQLDFGEDGAALDLLHRATLICEETGNRRVAAQVQHRLGECYLRSGDLDRATQAFEKVLTLVVAIGDKAGECYAAIGLGTVDLRRGRLEAAAKRLAVALALAVSVHEHMLEFRAALALAETELACGRVAEAAQRVDAVIDGAGEIKAVLLTAQALVLRGRIHDAGGESEAASAVWHRAETLLSGLKLQRRVALSDELALLLSRSRRPGSRVARSD